MTKTKDGGGGNKSAKREHHIIVTGGSICAYTPVEEQKQHATERKEDATTHATERNENRRREFKKILLEGFTLLAVLFYSSVTTWQGCMLRESITNNTTQFQIDQRPYVWRIEHGNPNDVHIVKNEKMYINIKWLNTGKSPAVNGTAVGMIFIGKTAMADAGTWFKNLGEGPLPVADSAYRTMVVPPGVPSDPDKPLGGYSSVETIDVLTEDQFSYIMGNDLPYAMVLRFQYFDMAGNRHWSDICMSRYKNGAITTCQTYNSMH